VAKIVILLPVAFITLKFRRLLQLQVTLAQNSNVRGIWCCSAAIRAEWSH